MDENFIFVCIFTFQSTIFIVSIVYSITKSLFSSIFRPSSLNNDVDGEKRLLWVDLLLLGHELAKQKLFSAKRMREKQPEKQTILKNKRRISWIKWEITAERKKRENYFNSCFTWSAKIISYSKFAWKFQINLLLLLLLVRECTIFLTASLHMNVNESVWMSMWENSWTEMEQHERREREQSVLKYVNGQNGLLINTISFHIYSWMRDAEKKKFRRIFFSKRQKQRKWELFALIEWRGGKKCRLNELSGICLMANVLIVRIHSAFLMHFLFVLFFPKLNMKVL